MRLTIALIAGLCAAGSLWGQAPAALKPMATDADPAFEVASIRPHSPAKQGTGIAWVGRNFRAANSSLSDLAAFAWGLHPRQIAGGPDWITTEKYEILGTSDVEGRPNGDQMRTMVRKLLADRFQLKTHTTRKSLPVYAITVAKGGTKMAGHAGDPNGTAGFGFPGLGRMVVKDGTIANFAGWLQRYVLDRPVVDRTGIAGRYSYELNWSPDESQFAGIRGVFAPVSGGADPPDLYTAMREQLGLRLKPVKAEVAVMVVDRVERPSEN